MTNKRLKKLLMAKGVPRNEANDYIKELKSTHQMSKEEFLNSIYVMKKDCFFILSPDWFDDVTIPSITTELASEKMTELMDRRQND